VVTGAQQRDAPVVRGLKVLLGRVVQAPTQVASPDVVLQHRGPTIGRPCNSDSARMVAGVEGRRDADILPELVRGGREHVLR
jgi:hypothetical protein